MLSTYEGCMSLDPLASYWTLDSSFLEDVYDNWKFFISVWFAQDSSSLWAFILFTCGTEERFDITKDSLEGFQIDDLDLPLGLSMLTSSEMALTSSKWCIAKVWKEDFIFANSLLGTTIQDGGMKERSNEKSGV